MISLYCVFYFTRIRNIFILHITKDNTLFQEICTVLIEDEIKALYKQIKYICTMKYICIISNLLILNLKQEIIFRM